LTSAQAEKRKRLDNTRKNPVLALIETPFKEVSKKKKHEILIGHEE
jgi:hypothetical protein